MQLNDLVRICLEDVSCVAVSCEYAGLLGECRRSLLSSSCDDSTIDVEYNWTIYFVNDPFKDTVTGYRCFNYADCLETNGCTRYNDEIQLSDLKQICSDDLECVAVSCEDKNGDGMCSRGFLSTSCGNTTMDEETNWTIYH